MTKYTSIVCLSAAIMGITMMSAPLAYAAPAKGTTCTFTTSANPAGVPTPVTVPATPPAAGFQWRCTITKNGVVQSNETNFCAGTTAVPPAV